MTAIALMIQSTNGGKMRRQKPKESLKRRNNFACLIEKDRKMYQHWETIKTEIIRTLIKNNLNDNVIKADDFTDQKKDTRPHREG